jgi:hypothetical protein
MSLTVAHAEPCPSPSQPVGVGFGERALLLFGGLVLLCGAVLWSDRGANVEKTDFSMTYVGARIVYEGQGARLYDLQEQARLRASLYTRAEGLIFEHPPFEALFLSPLAALPYKTAYLLWGLINAAIWLVLPWLLRPYAPVPRDDLAYFTLWFLFAPLGLALYQGQPSLILLLLYTMSFISLKHGQEMRGGILLGLGLFKFQFVLPFAIIFLLRRKWRFLSGFALSAMALGLFSLWAVRWQGILSYVHLLLNIAGHPDDSSYGKAIGMATVQGFMYTILGTLLGARVIGWVVAATSFSMLAFAARRWRPAKNPRSDVAFDLEFAAALVISLVSGFHMFLHDLSPLLLAMFLIAAHVPGHARLVLRAMLGIMLALLWIPPLQLALVAWHRVFLMFPVLMILAFAALHLAIAEEPGPAI